MKKNCQSRAAEIAMKIVFSGKGITAMATYKTIGGFRYFTNSGETRDEPPHVHVQKKTSGPKAKIWIFKKTSADSDKIEIAETGGFAEKQLANFVSNVRSNQFYFLQRYVEEMKNAGAAASDIKEVKQFMETHSFPDKARSTARSKGKEAAKQIIAFAPSPRWTPEMKGFFREITNAIPLLRNSQLDTQCPLDDAACVFRRWKGRIPGLEFWLDAKHQRHLDYRVQDYSESKGGLDKMVEYDIYSRLVDTPAKQTEAIRFINESLRRVYSRGK